MAKGGVMNNACLNTGADASFAQGNNVEDQRDGKPLTKCNDTAIVLAWAAVTPDFDKHVNPYGGFWRIQPEDYVDSYFHNEKNWEHFKTVRDLPLTHNQTDDVNGPYQPERISQYHQLALREVLGVGADFKGSPTFEKIVYEIRKGVAIILLLKSPGHYVTAVKYDPDKNMIGFKDPAPVKWKQDTMDADRNKWFGLEDMTNIGWGYTRVWRL